MDRRIEPRSIRLLALVSVNDSRQVWRALTADGVEVRYLKAVGLGGIRSLRRESRIVRDMSEAGLSAAPRILARGWRFIAYEASTGAVQGSESTLCHQRSPLDARASEAAAGDMRELLEHLHHRGMSMNQRPGCGWGFRADGSIIATDLSKISDANVSRVRADQRWLTSIESGAALHGRTLTRRGLQGVASGDDTRAFRPPGGHHGREGARRPAFGRRHGRAWALGLGGLVLVISGLSASWLHFFHQPTLEASVSSAEGEAVKDANESEPSRTDDHDMPISIDKPVELVETLSERRYDFITGHTDTNESALANSPAATDDLRVKEALQGMQADGGHTIVHDAEIQALWESEAHVRATISDGELHVLAHGHTWVVPATEPRDVIIHLVAHDNSWRVYEVRPAHTT